MYKVFFNDRTVFINTSFKKSLFRNGLFYEVLHGTDLPEIWEQFVNDKQQRNLYLTGNSLDNLKHFFFTNFKIIEAAGGLVFNEDRQLLCIERWGKWDLPKGKIEKGETKENAALREVEEETGLHGVKLIEFKDTTYHIYQSPRHNNQWILKPTYWYLMTYYGNEKPVPQVNEDIIKAVWIDKDQLGLIKQNTYASLQPLFELV